MITALARGYAVIGNERYLEAAVRAVEFILDSLTGTSSRLMRSYYLGKTSGKGFLEDYANFVGALIELHQVTFTDRYLEQASHFATEMLRIFGTDNSGALFESGNDGEKLLVKHISSHDGVMPSGNSMAALALLRLGRITGDSFFSKRGEAILRSFMGTVAQAPTNSLYFLSALDFSDSPEYTVTISGERNELKPFLCLLYSKFIPNAVFRYAGKGEAGNYQTLEGRPTVYVCAKNACYQPVNRIEALSTLLEEIT
ncbi:hypothetical protein [Geobacter sp. OR-1]|uniref:hypothetical protein n=1 Tax=Geobacter sp. OR-1 TaxID=1266765 RepID=UPI001ED99E8A|nr:hypothetical protein [Geobacter sp. OR-1]